MIDYHFLAIGILVSLIIFWYSLSKVLYHLDLDPYLILGRRFAFSFLILVISATSLFVCVVHCLILMNPSAKTYVNPSITTTKYEVTQVKRNLDSDEKTYELTSAQGDKATLSSEQYENLSKGDVLFQKQYTASRAQTGLAYRSGKFKTTEWFVVAE